MPAHRHILASRALDEAAAPCSVCGEPAWELFDLGVDGESEVCESCFAESRGAALSRVMQPPRRPALLMLSCLIVVGWALWLAPLAAYLLLHRLL